MNGANDIDKHTETLCRYRIEHLSDRGQDLPDPCVTRARYDGMAKISSKKVLTPIIPMRYCQ